MNMIQSALDQLSVDKKWRAEYDDWHGTDWINQMMSQQPLQSGQYKQDYIKLVNRIEALEKRLDKHKQNFKKVNDLLKEIIMRLEREGDQ